MNKSSKLIWIFAGESSGDLYGAHLAIELKKLAGENIRIAGMGSLEMRKAGVDIMVDSSELGIVGLIEVIKHLGTFIKIFSYLKKRAIQERPDAVVLIDYPGFNLRFAEEMFKNNIPVVWFICPHVWAWGRGRIPKLAKFCRKMLVIFPFESEVFKHTSLKVEFVGHPLMDILRAKKNNYANRDPKKFLLLPGSRRDEIKRLMPEILETISLLDSEKPGLEYIFSAPRDSIKKMVEQEICEFRRRKPAIKLPETKILCGETHRLLHECGTGLAASGTVTVEAAIAGLPLVVIYRVNPLTYWLGRIVIRKLFRGFITMVNIIASKEVYKEYLQHFTPQILKNDILDILPDGNGRRRIESDIATVVEMLSSGSSGACEKAAKAILDVTEEKIK